MFSGQRTGTLVPLAFLPAAIVLSLVLASCSKDQPIPADWQTVTDETFHYTVALPPGCAVSRPSDERAERRLDAKCPGNMWITLYAAEIKGVVDERKLSEIADKSWAGDYALTDTVYKPDVPALLRWLNEDQLQGISKIYEKGASLRVIATEAHSRFAYYILMDGPSDARNNFLLISKSLTVKFSATEAGYTVLFYLGTGILAWLLGLGGLWMRRSRMKLKALTQLIGVPNIDVSKLEAAMGSERGKLILIPLFCIALYVGGVVMIGSLFDPLSLAIFAIAGPFLPILGYFGIIREPSEGDIPGRI